MVFFKFLFSWVNFQVKLGPLPVQTSCLHLWIAILHWSCSLPLCYPLIIVTGVCFVHLNCQLFLCSLPYFCSHFALPGANQDCKYLCREVGPGSRFVCETGWVLLRLKFLYYNCDAVFLKSRKSWSCRYGDTIITSALQLLCTDICVWWRWRRVTLVWYWEHGRPLVFVFTVIYNNKINMYLYNYKFEPH